MWLSLIFFSVFRLITVVALERFHADVLIGQPQLVYHIGEDLEETAVVKGEKSIAVNCPFGHVLNRITPVHPHTVVPQGGRFQGNHSAFADGNGVQIFHDDGHLGEQALRIDNVRLIISGRPRRRRARVSRRFLLRGGLPFCLAEHLKGGEQQLFGRVFCMFLLPCHFDLHAKVIKKSQTGFFNAKNKEKDFAPPFSILSAVWPRIRPSIRGGCGGQTLLHAPYSARHRGCSCIYTP